MSAANFIPNPEPFPIWAITDDAPQLSGWICPDCSNAWLNAPVFLADNGDGSHTCPRCRCTTTAPEEDGCQWIYNRDAANDWADLVIYRLDWMNIKFPSFKLELKPGYFDGFQVLVKPDGDAAKWDLEDPDALAEYAGYRGEDPADVARSYARERDGLVKCLAEELPGYGFRPYRVAARFDNGETWYRVDEKE